MAEYTPEAIQVALSILTNGIGPVLLQREGGNKTLIGKAEDLIHNLLDEALTEFEEYKSEEPDYEEGTEEPYDGKF